MTSTDLLIAAAHAPAAAVDGILRALWTDHAAGLIDDQTAQTAAEILHARRQPIVRRSSMPRRRPRSPDRQRSIQRRRRLAAAGGMPPALAAHFTTGEAAALFVIASAGEISSMTVGEIAARAGVGETTARGAIRRAAAMGLLIVKERRRPGRPSLSNVITIVAPEWLVWLRLGRVRKTDDYNHKIHLEMRSRPLTGGKDGRTQGTVYNNRGGFRAGTHETRTHQRENDQEHAAAGAG